MKKKHLLGTTLLLGSFVTPAVLQTAAVVRADEFYQYQSTAQAADITNWIASTPEQIKQNMQNQNIRVDESGSVVDAGQDGQIYVIQWGDTLWGISQATGISIAKLAYDNNIQNVDLIYAGDTLILKRDGQVPVDYKYNGYGQHCAMTKVVINNYIHNGNNYIYNDNSTNVNVDVTLLQQSVINIFPEVDQSQIVKVEYKPDIKVEDAPEWKQSPIQEPSEEEKPDIVSPFDEPTNSDSGSTSSPSGDGTPGTSGTVPTESSSAEPSESSTSPSSTSSSKLPGSDESTPSSTKPSSSEKVLEMDEYLDKIQAEISNLKSKDLNSSSNLTLNFLDNKDEFNQNANRIAGLDMEQLYTPRAEVLATDVSQKTETSAKKVAEEIYAKLKARSSDLEDAQYLQITLTKEGGRDAFNVKVYKELEESSSSSSSSSSSTPVTRSSSSSDDYEDFDTSSSESTFSRTETSTSSDSYEE
ncbi:MULTISPECIES: LysM domain-containing protein [unclassified Streptococcus]|uniref:LysM peptidoglycan-binding domain-containing protein n=1 Tax=unclassified Streptococcus TaxID=2608887 RepID=UPI0018A8C30C|nr:MULTISPECIES: LysM domain-containing protein [unclassified Streptococcus]MBF8969774.1 LysM peptidoglycan-binding domain-containing protein [Streptococcus sp. NLN76]MBG9368197.1 LysM peptidoglycan-binding domain-containing protein [Streptococcus sp. NLN64]